jgi:multicomponent Na+:H+ antiporter subunit F
MDNSFFLRSLDVLITLLMISMLLASWRLYRGPNTPNRTVAFDLIAIHAVGVFALFAIRLGSSDLLDGAIITAVLGFLGAMMFARYLEQSDQEDWKDDER